MTIYIVDDNCHLSEFLTCLLESDGHTVHSFTRPEDALSHMQVSQIQPSILITDYNMPAMNGYNLHLQTLQHAPNVKTIVISGRNVSGEIGDLRFVQKPFAPNELSQLVKSMKEEL